MVATFLKAALAGDAVEETALLALADWLDEKSDPRGTLLRRRLKAYQRWHVVREWLALREDLRDHTLRREVYRRRYKLRKAEGRLRAWLADQFCPRWPYWAKWTFPATAE